MRLEILGLEVLNLFFCVSREVDDLFFGKYLGEVLLFKGNSPLASIVSFVEELLSWDCIRWIIRVAEVRM